jgi:hypothetical protein
MSSNAGKFQDRTPNIRAAGKVIPIEGSAKECIRPLHSPKVTPDVVKKFQGTKSLLRPEPGQERIIHARFDDPNTAAEIRHGVNTKPSTLAGDLVNPKPQTTFNQMKQDQKEMIYASNHKAPLGTSHDQGPGLPQGLDPTQVAFGLLTVRDGSASEMVSPNKSRDQVEQETQQGKHLYIKSHGSYEVGELHVLNCHNQ